MIDIRIIKEVLSSKELIIELIRATPAYIALIISIVVPFFTKKLDIEKTNSLFLIQERYKIYKEHFKQLQAFNTSLKLLLSTLLIIHKSNNDLDMDTIKIELQTNIKNFYNEWSSMNNKDSDMWLVADYEILVNNSNLLKLVSTFSNVLNLLNKDGVFTIEKSSLEKLIDIAKEIQEIIAEYLKKYRKFVDAEILKKK